MNGKPRCVGVVHTLLPGHPEWKERLERAAQAWRAGDVDAIILTGGVGYEGKEPFNNPELMRAWILEKYYELSTARIFSTILTLTDAHTPRNVVNTADEVEQALGIIQENGWEDCTIRPISNGFHLRRVGRIWRAKAARRGLHSLRLEPLPCRRLLDLNWVLTKELPMLLYTLFDPGWEKGPAQRLRAKLLAGEVTPAGKT